MGYWLQERLTGAAEHVFGTRTQDKNCFCRDNTGTRATSLYCTALHYSAKQHWTAESAQHSCFKGLGLLSRFIPLKWFLAPCSPLLIPGIFAVAKIRPKYTYEHQCSFNSQCCIFTFKLVKQWQTVALAWNSCGRSTNSRTVLFLFFKNIVKKVTASLEATGFLFHKI